MIRLTLIGLVVFGLWSGGRLSYSHFQTGEACPILGVVPACYIAFIGYLMMALALAVTTAKPELNLSWMFWLGLLAAGGLALLGSGLELAKGNVCPKAFGWLPMCYVSLAFSVLIGILFAAITRNVTPAE
ncbi:MAG: hypothetical protein GXP26_02560 [Planctomycetes bacterium]|nr:hypothetical protein [Planctomycetota bacterium]